MAADRPFLGYGRQNIDNSDVDAVIAVLRGDFLTQGPAIDRFEVALAEYTGARYAVAVSNGTAALHIACLAAGVGPGDLAATAAISFAASANCIRYAGGEVEFLDIDRVSLGITVEGVKQALQHKPQTKVVIPVHMAGVAHQSAEIRKAAGDRIVIEDAAHSLGGRYECGRAIGCCRYSDMTILSFHPVKSITTGEGGAVLTNDEELARKLRSLRSHGIERDAAHFVGTDVFEDGEVKPWYYEQQELGFNYRMTDIQAALGYSQLARLDRFVARRRQIAQQYDEVFSKLPGLSLPQSDATQRARSGLHLYIVHIDFTVLKTTRAAVMKRLRTVGIGTQVHYIPIYQLPYYAERYQISRTLFPAAEYHYETCLSIPMHPGLNDDDVEHVIAQLRQSIGA